MKLEDQLLYASLVCGIAPGGDPAHRLQLYFCAIEEPYSKSHIDDFQRALETGVDSKGLWENYSHKGSGGYFITERGYTCALNRHGRVDLRFSPARSGQFICNLAGRIDSIYVQICSTGKWPEIILNGQLFQNKSDACEYVNARTGKKLPVSRGIKPLYNLGIDEYGGEYFDITLSDSYDFATPLATT